MRSYTNQRSSLIIPLVLLLVIIFILTVIAVPKYLSLSNEVENSVCVVNQKTIEAAIMMKYSEELLAGKSTSVTRALKNLDGSSFVTNSIPTCPENDNSFIITEDDNTLNITVTCPNRHSIAGLEAK